MAEIKKRRPALRPTKRRLVQLYCALLYNANIKGLALGRIYTGPAKNLCVPGLNCYSCPGAVGACPLGALQNAMAASGTRAGTYVLGILMLYGLLLGRTVCGWLCPFGMVQELLHKFPTPKIRKSRATRILSGLKYLLLLVLVFLVPLLYGLKRGLPLPAFCKYICPAGTLEGAGGLLIHPANKGLFSMLGSLFARKALILALVLVSCIFCYRSFCRFLCPLGALYGLFSRIALAGVKVDGAACTGCGACVRTCPMDTRYVGDRECIHCGGCRKVCGPGAISFRAGKTSLEQGVLKDRAGGALRILLPLLLAALLAFVNLRPSKEAPLPAGETGFEAGQFPEDFSVSLMDGGSFSLYEARGHVTFINLWATYCAPCVEEIPYFERLRQEHEEVRILALHASLVTEDVGAYLEEKGWDLDFALDDEDGSVFALLGGDALLPRTIVLDREGRVVYNQAGSVTYEKLEKLLVRAEQEQP